MSSLLQFFKNETTDATLYRKAAGTYVEGDWSPGAETSSPIRIIVPQPVQENDLLPLPEGEKVSDFRKTWSETLFRTREGDQDADEIEYLGKRYKVFQVDNRDVLGGFYRAIIREVL